MFNVLCDAFLHVGQTVWQSEVNKSWPEVLKVINCKKKKTIPVTGLGGL
jgi:hypothetical protein